MEEALEQYARPVLKTHCGDVRVTRIEGDTVYVRLLGQCSSCASAYLTVDELLEKVLQEHVPGIKHVVLDDFDFDFYQQAKDFLKHRDSTSTNAAS